MGLPGRVVLKSEGIGDNSFDATEKEFEVRWDISVAKLEDGLGDFCGAYFRHI